LDNIYSFYNCSINQRLEVGIGMHEAGHAIENQKKEEDEL
jgi:hypothetical protein